MQPQFNDPKNPDMSPEAIADRLRMVEALRKLCVSLKEAGDAHRAKQAADTVLIAAIETPAT